MQERVKKYCIPTVKGVKFFVCLSSNENESLSYIRILCSLLFSRMQIIENDLTEG
jgi:hypothetical protein